MAAAAAWARWGRGGGRHGVVPVAGCGHVAGPVCRACCRERELRASTAGGLAWHGKPPHGMVAAALAGGWGMIVLLEILVCMCVLLSLLVHELSLLVQAYGMQTVIARAKD